MKLTKRMKNAIIQGVVVNIVFLLLLSLWVVFFSLPRITSLETKKQDLLEAYESLKNIQKKWINYEELRREVNTQWLNEDVYIRTLMRNIDGQFYSKNFSNTGSQEYRKFLWEREKEIFQKKSSDEYINKDNTLAKVLPTYNKNSTSLETGLSDLHFINYIEKLIYSFDLLADGEIGVWDIEKVWINLSQKEKSQLNTLDPESGLQESIFKIPLRFKITGRKADIVDFIHFFENVGSISVDGSNLSIYNDKFISKTLVGEKRGASYNIYEHQFADIQSLKFEDYPDSSAIPDGGKSLLSLMKWDQAGDKVSVDIDLWFYVAGLPAYKMEKYVQDFFERFKKLSLKISQDAKKYTLQAYKFTEWRQIQSLQALQSLDILMLSLEEKVSELRREFATKTNIENTYKSVVDYTEQLNRVEKNYNTQIEKLLKGI